MKKKTSLFLIILLILFTLGALLIYLFNKPTPIVDEAVGTQYSTEDIQFDLISETFSTIPSDVIKHEEKALTNFVSSDNKIIMISSMDRSDLFIDYELITKPLYIFKEEFIETCGMFSSGDWRFAIIKVFNGENKNITYYYLKGAEEDGTFSRTMEVSMNDSYYLITLGNYNSEDDIEADAYEIMRSINIKN